MFMSYHQSSGQNYYAMTINNAFENMAKFKYVGVIVTNKSCIHEEIKQIIFR